MVQARNGTTPIGKFSTAANATSLDCSNLPQSSIAQSDKSKKNSVHLKWEIPGTFSFFGNAKMGKSIICW
jgi:hypothetical protein